VDAIEAARAADISELLPLLEAYWRHDHIEGFDAARLRGQLEAFLSNPALGLGWLAREVDACVGYLLCVFTYSFEHGGLMAEVDELFVAQSARGRGMGAALLEAAGAALRQRGGVALQLQVADGNAAARRFYAKAGFARKAGYALWVRTL
jgi:GNAT superfamily N-acetyltransferase